MPEITRINYSGSGESVTSDRMGMRPMQRKVYEKRKEQYILLKSPPASGKSRACMFIALDKMIYQGLRKTVIAVPERTIASSFRDTRLTDNGFYADWEIDPEYNLCSPGSESRKTKKFEEFFFNPGARVMLCTHATLRFAFSSIGRDDLFDGCFLAIDEFHHNSADTESSRLGSLVKTVIESSSAHILAMTGSYFRGDGVPVLDPETERKFTSVTFSYYDQLSGYKYLKAITLSYDFYQGDYFRILGKDLDTTKKTIIHIPNINSAASTKDKAEEVNTILSMIGDEFREDLATGVLYVTARDGRELKVIDLVDDEPRMRRIRQKYLAEHAEDKDAVDIIIALNLAKEGFDFPPCERMLTVGYRGSLTEIVQIIGRCTRDYPGKSEAAFINIVAEPDAECSDVSYAVNNLLKAITASLLMEQVLLPKWSFKDKLPKLQLLEPRSKEARDIIENDLEDLVYDITKDPEVMEAMPKKNAARLINKLLVPKIIKTKYPGLDDDDAEAVRQAVVTNLVAGKLLQENHEEKEKEGSAEGMRLLRFSKDLVVDVRDLDINLIDEINPFEESYRILSQSFDKKTLAMIRDELDRKKGRIRTFTDTELKVYTPQVLRFAREHGGNPPERYSDDPYEAMLGDVFWYLYKEHERMEEHG